MLVVAMQHREKLFFHKGQIEVVRVGARNFRGGTARRALDELIESEFVRLDQGIIYVVTPTGADTAAAMLAIRGPAWADERDPETEAG